jgi:hypothetical protein
VDSSDVGNGKIVLRNMDRFLGRCNSCYEYQDMDVVDLHGKQEDLSAPWIKWIPSVQ